MGRKTALQTVRSLILRASILVFLLLSFVILFYGMGKAKWIGSFSILFLVSALFAFYLYLEKGSVERNKKATIITFALLVFWQLFILFGAKPVLRHDALKVFDEALSMLKLGGITPSHFDDYFLRYTNNQGMLFLTYGVLKLAKITGLLALDPSGGMRLVQVLNLLAIDYSLILGMLFLRRLYGTNYEKAYLLFVLFCPLHYVWVAFYYTNTIAMPFYMGFLYLLSKSLRENKWPALRMAVVGILAVVGFYLRATNAIMVIAFFVYLLFKRKHKELGGRIGMSLLICVIAMALTVFGYQQLLKKYVHYDTTDTAFPAIHWVMMGLSGEGDFNQRDEMYTRSFETKQEKKDADKTLLQERVEELGAGGVFAQGMKKLKLTFGDGTGNYAAELSMSDTYGVVDQIVYGRLRGALETYCQLFYLMLILCSMLAGVRLFLSSKMSEVYMFLISLTGGYLFHMLWEAGSIYSIGFMPLLYVGAAVGFVSAADWFLKNAFVSKQKKETLKTVYFPILLLVFASLLAFASTLMKSREQNGGNDYSMNQFMLVFGQYQPCDIGSPLTQTFTTQKEFDTIEVMVHNTLFEANDGIYEVVLLTEAGSVISSWDLKARDCQDLTYQTFGLSEPLSQGSYQLRLQKKDGLGNLEFPYYGTGNYDLYKGGSLEGVEEDLFADLTMKVYLSQED